MESSEKESKNFSYDINLKIDKGVYHFHVPELMLFSKGSDVQSAYQKLMLERDNLFQSAEDAGIQIPQAASPRKFSMRQPKGRLVGSNTVMSYFLESIMAGAIFFLTAFFTLQMAQSTMKTSLNNVSKHLEKSIEHLNHQVKQVQRLNPGRLIEKELYRAADHPISLERQEKIIKSIRVIVKRMRPFIREVSPLFSKDAS